jgi:hypothetical protein
MSLFPTTALTGVGPADLAWLAGSWLGHNGPDAVGEPITKTGLFAYTRRVVGGTT